MKEKRGLCPSFPPNRKALMIWHLIVGWTQNDTVVSTELSFQIRDIYFYHLLLYLFFCFSLWIFILSGVRFPGYCELSHLSDYNFSLSDFTALKHFIQLICFKFSSHKQVGFCLWICWLILKSLAFLFFSKAFGDSSGASLGGCLRPVIGVEARLVSVLVGRQKLACRDTAQSQNFAWHLLGSQVKPLGLWGQRNKGLKSLGLWPKV